MLPDDPRNGVRDAFFLVERGEDRARYRCEVHTAEGRASAEVDIGREGATLPRADDAIEPAQQAQRVVLAHHRQARRRAVAAAGEPLARAPHKR